MKEVNELAIDAVAEFTNTFTGHIYNKLDENHQPIVNAPQFHGNQFELALTSCTTLQFDSGQFQIQVAIGMVD